MIEAAALAASSASGERCSLASPTIAAMTLRLREASAVATRVPHRCCSLSSVSITRAARLSRWSLAYAGSFSFRASIDIEILREGMRRVVGAASTWPARSSSCRRCMQPRSRHPVRALLLGSPEGLRCHALAICPAGRVRNGRDGWPRRYRTCETNAGLYSAPVRGDPRLSVGCTGECADCVRVVPWGNDLDGERLLVQRDHPIGRLGVRVSSL